MAAPKPPGQAHLGHTKPRAAEAHGNTTEEFMQMSQHRPSPPPRSSRLLRPALATGLALACLLGSSSVWAKDPQRLRTRALAATCAQCHGTEGNAVAGEALVHLAGMPKDYLITQLLAFRTGQRPATVMHQITRGYSQEQLEELAAFFAAQK